MLAFFESWLTEEMKIEYVEVRSAKPKSNPFTTSYIKLSDTNLHRSLIGRLNKRTFRGHVTRAFESAKTTEQLSNDIEEKIEKARKRSREQKQHHEPNKKEDARKVRLENDPTNELLQCSSLNLLFYIVAELFSCFRRFESSSYSREEHSEESLTRNRY
jgi:hypothetical protein